MLLVPNARSGLLPLHQPREGLVFDWHHLLPLFHLLLLRTTRTEAHVHVHVAVNGLRLSRQRLLHLSLAHHYVLRVNPHHREVAQVKNHPHHVQVTLRQLDFSGSPFSLSFLLIIRDPRPSEALRRTAAPKSPCSRRSRCGGSCAGTAGICACGGSSSFTL